MGKRQYIKSGSRGPPTHGNRSLQRTKQEAILTFTLTFEGYSETLAPQRGRHAEPIFARAWHRDTHVHRLSLQQLATIFGLWIGREILIQNHRSWTLHMYNLRPERKRKRPARYQSESGDELEPSSNSTNHTTAYVNVPKNPFGTLAHQTQNQSPLTPLTSTSLASLAHSTLPIPQNTPTTGTSPVAQHHRSMPNVRYIRKHSQDPRADEHRDNDLDSIPAVRRPINRPPARLAQYVPPSIYPSVKPAAFPSLLSTGPPPEEFLTEGDQPGVRELMEAMEKSDQKGIHMSKCRVDNMYNNEDFPIHMREEERVWYADLTKQWGPNDTDTQVTFASLWPSLRQSIINEVRDAFPQNAYYDPYHPVKCLLGLSQPVFSAILSENNKAWNVNEDIPQHIREYKKLHPDESVDPDEPPPREIVKAIRFLKQEHLPGSLLGEWQFPLPRIEEFHKWSQACEKVVTLTEPPRGLHSVPSREADDRPNILNIEQTRALIARYEKKQRYPFTASNDAVQNGNNGRASQQVGLQTQGQAGHVFAESHRSMPNALNGSGVEHQTQPSTTSQPRPKVCDRRQIINQAFDSTSKQPNSTTNRIPHMTWSAPVLPADIRPGILSQGLSSSEFLALRACPQPPIRTVEDLQVHNRAHPGLCPNAPQIRRINEELGVTQHIQYPTMNEIEHNEWSQRDSMNLYAPLSMTTCAADYAQASVLNSMAARRQVAANAMEDEEENRKKYEERANMLLGD